MGQVGRLSFQYIALRVRGTQISAIRLRPSKSILSGRYL